MEIGEHRVVRRGPDGALYQWSNASSTPSGTGWTHASKATFPRVRSYLWYRDAANIQRDRENRKKRQQAIMDRYQSKDAGTRIAAMLTPEYWLSKVPKKAEDIQKNTRVKFENRVYYVVKDNQDSVDIVDAISGDVKSVNHDELDEDDTVNVRYGRGDLVNITPGAIHPDKDIDAVIVDFDEQSLKYKVAIGETDADKASPRSIVSIFPEAINAIVQKTPENIPELRDKMRKIAGGPFSEESKRVIDIVETAARNGRSTVTEKEVHDLLMAIGEPVPMNTIAGTLASLRGYMPSSDYNSSTGVLFIRNSRDSLKAIRKELGIPQRMDTIAWKNYTSADKNSEMVFEDQHVVTKDGVLDGIVEKVEGGMVRIADRAGKKFLVELNKLMDFKSRKQLVMDPSNPQSFGKLNTSDIFWTLRDREHCQEYKLGEGVTLLPGLNVPGRKQASFTARQSGKIIGIRNDGTIQVRPDDGGPDWVVSPRQLLANKKFENLGKAREYIEMRRSEAFNRSIAVGDVEVRIGKNPGVDGGDKKVEIVFPTGKSYLDHEADVGNGFVTTAVVPGTGVSSWKIPFLHRESSPEESLVPTRTVAKIIDKLYPNAKTITIARSGVKVGSPVQDSRDDVKVAFHIDSKSAEGFELQMDKIRELYGTSDDTFKVKASDLSDYYSAKMKLNDARKQVDVKIGRDLELTHGLLPALLAEREVKDDSGKSHRVPSGNLLFRDVVETTSRLKQEKWGNLPNAAQLIEDSSVFTYDPATRQYSFDLGNYDRAHRFLKAFFGDTLYDRTFWETRDGGFYARASNKNLQNDAERSIKYYENLRAQRSNVSDLTDQEADGLFIKPRKYQNAAIHFAASRDSALLALDQGTGKTISGIASAVIDLNRWHAEDPTRKRRVLIVAPASVAQTSWMNDLKQSLTPMKEVVDKKGNKVVVAADPKDTEFPNRRQRYGFTLLMGENRTEQYKRLADPKDNTCFAVTSFETFANSDYKELKDIGFDKVIIDEAQTIKNSSDSAVISQKIKMAMADASKKLALTGTPIENSPADLQSILSWLDPEAFGDSEKFMRDFVETDLVETYDARGKKMKRAVGIGLKNRKVLRDKLDTMMFRVVKDELLEDNIYREMVGDTPNTISVEDLNKGVLERYMKMPDGPAKKKLGEVSVVPKRVVYPAYEVSYDSAVKDLKVMPNSSSDPLFIENYPEYHRMVELARQQLRRDFMEIVKKGQRPNYNVVFTRLQQVMNDPSLVADKLGPQFATPVQNPKVDALIKHVKQHFSNGVFSPQVEGKIIVFTYETKTVKFIEEQLVKAFPNLRGRILKFVGDDAGGEVRGRAEIERAFNKDPDYRYPIMIANAAAKTGVNLPTANFVINYDIGWNPQDLAQRIDRAHRVRSIKSIAEDASIGLPPRDVKSVLLTVTSKDGSVNSTIEARKLATHKYKNKMFNAVVNNNDQETFDIQLGDDHAARAEALLGASNPEGHNRVDDRERRAFEIRKAIRTNNRNSGFSRWFGFTS